MQVYLFAVSCLVTSTYCRPQYEPAFHLEPSVQVSRQRLLEVGHEVSLEEARRMINELQEPDQDINRRHAEVLEVVKSKELKGKKVQNMIVYPLFAFPIVPHFLPVLVRPPEPRTLTKSTTKKGIFANLTPKPEEKKNEGNGIFINKLKVRKGGVAIAGPGGIATAGSGGTAIVGPNGVAYTHPDGLAIAGAGTKVVAVDPSVNLMDLVTKDYHRTKFDASSPRVGRVVATGPVIYYNKG